MTQESYNRLLFIVGIIGFPISIHASEGHYRIIALCGVGLFSYLIVSSIVDSIQRRKR